jgi:F0F1-type ATP synthase delta subunit
MKGIWAERELKLFFKDNNKESFSNFLEDTKWPRKLDYLADIYQHLNTFNTSRQGPKENVLTSTDRLLAFKNKIQVLKRHLSSRNTEMFLLLLQIQDQSDYKEVIPLIISHLESLADSLNQYFPSLSSEMYDWVRNLLLGSHKIH